MMHTTAQRDDMTVHIIDAFKTLVMRLTAAQLGSTAKATDTMMAQFFLSKLDINLARVFWGLKQ